jgi:hypothetical protein
MDGMYDGEFILLEVFFIWPINFNSFKEHVVFNRSASSDWVTAEFARTFFSNRDLT